MKLRGRLLLSYLVVIVATLLVSVVVLVFALEARPVPPDIAYRNLLNTAQIGLRGLIGEGARQQGPRLNAPATLERLSTFTEETGMRTLVISGETVIFDSANIYTRETPINLRPSPIAASIENGLPRLLRDRVDISAGNFVDPDGSEWIYVGLSGASTAGLILLAEQPPTQSLGAALNEFQPALVMPLVQSALVGLVIALVMSALVSRTIAHPLQRIARATTAVAEGDYGQQVPVSGPPEVRAVGEAFNHMSAQVKASQQAQRDFLVNVSHDLKTPLTSIQGYAQAIVDGASPDPQQSAVVIYEEATRLNRLVHDITDLARLQNGQLAIQRQPLDLNRIVTTIGERLRNVAQGERITLFIDTTPLPPIQGDGDRLAQVITNLVSNAIKYTPAGGRIWLKTQMNNGGVEISVQDTGIGISEADLPRVFERFYQVDRARGPQRGTGLGLAITQEIVGAHDGHIAVTSAGSGQGTTFTVWLPSPALKTSTTR